MHNACKSLVQLEDLRRREKLLLSSDGPMVRLFGEDTVGARFEQLPTSLQLAIKTPLGHYKTKAAELGIDPIELVAWVKYELTQQGDSFALHHEDGRAIGIWMYFALKHAVLDIVDPGDPVVSRIIRDTFLV